MLAESPHTEGTVYMTVARHKMGDYEPHVFKTTDWGDSWTRITGADGAEIPAGEYCRVIREDPNRKGLLYVGTEHGLHVSFDDGGHWQPLQSNLPVTPMYDLVIKDDDLIVATHGRSFWILDDLTRLYQAHDLATGADGLDRSAPALMAPRECGAQPGRTSSPTSGVRPAARTTTSPSARTPPSIWTSRRPATRRSG